MAGNWPFRARKAPRNPILTIPRNMATFDKKSKKIGFLTPKIVIKNFSKSIFFADEARPPNQYWGSIHHIGAPKAPLSCCIGHTPSYRNLALKIPKKIQKTIFFCESVVFVAFVAFSVLLMLFFKISKIRRYS